MSSAGNRDFDEILKEIAKALHKKEDIDNLGKALGFGTGDIGRKIDENAKQGGNYMGTLDLLRTWRNKQTPSTENAALREALFKAGFDNLAAQYLITPVTVDIPTMLPSSTVIQGASLNRTDPNVTEKQLLKLAGCLPANSYTDLAVHLGVSYTEHDNIKLQNQSSLKDANFKMLMKWKCRENGGKVRDLDEALNKADCGGIVYKDV
ncbi:uncharacterized protein LOC100892994 [Strongylocentrotus purpuratus]|uniref:Death domain-containing protein n=1 Tax=Strongylocentrotus purpuratus TaxID=7668 RepID=A0A7M7GLV4_STRPU|nr:uncharacterized protein LOC100892994 [Strongylocentrotus purpuratus]|eukprot:XP_003728152.1 PREDICTED: uncharacterized protein LOC100892994 [Strongylocentrotus purpuratus]